MYTQGTINIYAKHACPAPEPLIPLHYYICALPLQKSHTQDSFIIVRPVQTEVAWSSHHIYTVIGHSMGYTLSVRQLAFALLSVYQYNCGRRSIDRPGFECTAIRPVLSWVRNGLDYWPLILFGDDWGRLGKDRSHKVHCQGRTQSGVYVRYNKVKVSTLLYVNTFLLPGRDYVVWAPIISLSSWYQDERRSIDLNSSYPNWAYLITCGHMVGTAARLEQDILYMPRIPFSSATYLSSHVAHACVFLWRMRLGGKFLCCSCCTSMKAWSSVPTYWWQRLSLNVLERTIPDLGETFDCPWSWQWTALR